jgi:hypothetical protein
MKKPNQIKGSEVSSSSSHKHWVFPGRLENEAAVLHSILPKYSIPYYRKCVNDMRGLIQRLVNNHGFNHGSKRYNIIKNYTIELIEGREPENPGWLATSRSFDIPSALGVNTIRLIKDYISSTDSPLRDDKYYQVILTLLSISRKVKGLSETDYKSITDKATPINVDLLTEFETYVSNMLEPHRYKRPEVNLTGYPTSIKKKGPNGVYKVESAHEEAIELMAGKLRNPFRNVCSYMNCNYLPDYLDQLAGIPVESPLNSPIRLRVIVPIPDSGFKTRVVAIPDFWTQLILEPVRDHVLKVTKELFGKTDFRLNQDAGVASMINLQELCIKGEVINGHKLSIDELGFIDISSWTDRFHRDLQKIMMKELFSPYLAEHWAQLVVHCDWYAPELGHTVKYGQGQGMGTNGSFDIATLTDHLFMKFLREKDPVLRAIESELPEIYGKVGDDLFTYGYKRILAGYEQINLPINLSKSKVSCKLGSVAEFCARTVINGTDVSRISPSIIQKSKDFRYLPLLLTVCASRGVDIQASSFPQLLNKVKGTEVTYLEMLQPYLISLYLVGQTEQSSVATKLTREKMEQQGWLLNDSYKEIIDTPLLTVTVLLASSIVSMSATMGDLQDKIFDMVEGMEFYGDEVIDLINKDVNLYDPESELVKYVCTGPFLGQHILLPKQLVVLKRYMNHRSLIRDELDEIIMQTPETPGELLQMVRAVSRVTHKACYAGGDLSYDTEKMFNIQFAMTKVLDRLDLQENILTLPDDGNIRQVLTYINYDDITERWSNELPRLSLER